MMDIEIKNIYCPVKFFVINYPIVNAKTYEYRVAESSAPVARERTFFNGSAVRCVQVTTATYGDFYTFSFS